MSTPIPMPAPLPYTNPIITSNQQHQQQHHQHHHQTQSIHSQISPTNNLMGNAAETSSMSPSNVSTHSSFPPPSSTAATSPSSTFIVNHQPGSAFNQASSTPAALVHNPNSVTRILQLTEFSKDLKTRDIQLVFADWEDDRGGFKIKWVDDTSCLVVFADPGVAKRAFLSVLSNPPPALTNSQLLGQKAAKLRAYNGPDVVHILSSVQNRPRSRSNASQSLHSRASSMASVNGGGGNGGLGRRPSMGALAARNRASISGTSGRAPPPQANPIVQAQVQELIDHVTTAHTVGGTNSNRPPSSEGELSNLNPPTSVRARIEDAGKRFIAAGLGKPSSSIPGLDDGLTAAGYSLANLTIEEEVTTPTTATH
ncbi:uncharacterized protein MELLADRAFT_115778 [Melampsora larici-populina 98AG31]|uniref:Uncharacterized protein n=1 Tax=Melampsora larici-populina (strain 98AG31 / pathotype 3-4-7) TaxID=747676 RepID=F4RE25_MELLP|nr:uncharacterized protein MELLADRAFT_115778 [Melampsora larici-populina 98AG31]EGG09513.1 hypothetical protein MELLADRAFT_115778 [Melampsora larici-populina 98AG31]